MQGTYLGAGTQRKDTVPNHIYHLREGENILYGQVHTVRSHALEPWTSSWRAADRARGPMLKGWPWRAARVYTAKGEHLGRLFPLLPSLHPNAFQRTTYAPYSYYTHWPSPLGVASSPGQGVSLPASIPCFLFSQGTI